MTVGLVIVSHSAALATGVVELAGQMAPDITIEAAGGGEDGLLGTDFDRISTALCAAESGDGVVVLYDLGSALLTTETALEFLDPDDAARIIVVDAALVEGALAAAVSAQAGDDREAVAAAARNAVSTNDQPSNEQSTNEPTATAEVELTNPLGLHARPAAQLNTEAARWDATVTLGRPGEKLIPVRNVLAVVSMALRGGHTVHLAADGPQAQESLTAITALIRTGFREKNETPNPAARSGAALIDGVITATAAAPGLALGPAHLLNEMQPTFPAVTPGNADQETARLTGAITAAQQKLAPGSPFDQAHAAMVADPTLRQKADAAIHLGAEQAWWQAVIHYSRTFADSPDETVAARAVDLREAGTAVLQELGITLSRIPTDLAGRSVLATELGPAEVPQLIRAGAAGVILTGSSSTAHAVIVSRGLGIPMVIRAGAATSAVTDGQLLIVDGDAGTVNLHPSQSEQLETTARITERKQAAEELKAQAQQQVQLADGTPIKVCANVGSVLDAIAAVENGADGVGLLRTELLVLDRRDFPDEQTQYEDLSKIFQVLGAREVVVRVLDAGGDKPVKALKLDPTSNGFLGVRGLRWLLANPEILHTQLRAICRAATGVLHVMAPMVTYAYEVIAFREAVRRAVTSLKQERIQYTEPAAVGVMIEVPAAALAADEICAVADFISIGTNDLTSYTMAADRTVPGVADLLDPGATAITRLIEQICRLAAATNTPVAVCGEMAAIPAHATALIKLGVTELSMAPSRIPLIKHSLNSSATSMPTRQRRSLP